MTNSRKFYENERPLLKRIIQSTNILRRIDCAHQICILVFTSKLIEIEKKKKICTLHSAYERCTCSSGNRNTKKKLRNSHLQKCKNNSLSLLYILFRFFFSFSFRIPNFLCSSINNDPTSIF